MKLSKKAENYVNSLSKKNIYWFEDTSVKFVCLFEKSSQIKSLNAVLGSAKDTKHIKNISLAGHTMRLKNFEEYNSSLKDKTWYKLVKDNDIPFIPEKYELTVKEKSTGRFKTDYAEMVSSAKRAFTDTDYIIMATDPDNEGCALGMEVIYAAGAEDKVIGMINMSKLDFFSLQEEVKHLNKIPFWEMAEAGFARAEFDWAFGLNNTILASVLLGSGQTCHIGGVKSPVVRMVVDRMNHIDNFKPEKFWRFSGTAKHSKTNKTFDFIVKVKQNSNDIVYIQNEIDILESKLNSLDKNNAELSGEISELYNTIGKLKWKLTEATKEFESSERDIFSQKIKKQIETTIKKGMNFKVTNFTHKKGLTQNPPLAYSLTDLQAEAGNLHKFSPSKTLQIAQKLYEEQWQSYPRTDSRYYASGEMSNIKKIIPNLLGLTSFSNVNIPTPYKVNSGVFNSSKVSAHTGLAPTTKTIDDNSLSDDNKLIYDMVATRYLIQFMNKFEYYQIKIDVDVNTEIYITTYENVEVIKGWRELYNPQNMYGFTYVQKQTLPNMLIGDEIEICNIERHDLETKPKPMFNNFSLLKGMENISRIYEELEGLEKGIGTPATRASILEQLFKAKYLIKKGNVVIASDKAKRLIELLPDDMSSPKLRADMEAKLNEIVDGIFTRSEYELEFKSLIEKQTQQLHEIAKQNKLEVIDKATLPPSEAQLKFANQVSEELKISIPKEALELKDEMTQWLKKNEKKMPVLLSDKQYAFLSTYGQDDEKILKILEAHDNKTLTKTQKFEAGKWLGSYMRTSDFHKKRAAKASETRKKNREAKMKALGIKTPTVSIKSLIKKKGTKKDKV